MEKDPGLPSVTRAGGRVTSDVEEWKVRFQRSGF